MPLPSLSDEKTYLQLTTTGDDALLTSLQADAISAVERDTGRTFASGSNSVTRYSTDGQTSIVIHDRPYTDASRTVTLGGVTMNESGSSANVWFLPDRRDQAITTTIQLRYYDTSRIDWYKADPQWFDKNLDNPRGYGASPNDLVITGVKGHPFPQADISWAVKFSWAVLYFAAKAGASGVVYTPTGEPIDIDGESLRYQKFVREWRIRTAVAIGG